MFNQVPAIVTLGAEGMIVLSLASQEWSDALLVDVLGLDACAGVSESVNTLSRLADGAREATWAREGARSEGQRAGDVRRRRDALHAAHGCRGRGRRRVGARTADRLRRGARVRARALAEGLLRCEPVMAGGEQDRSACTGRPLVYRMQRVSELTDRNLVDVHDIAELHLALKAKDLLDRI